MECRQLLSTLWVTNTNDDTNPNSLRWAILQADTDAGGDAIDFDIPSPGPVSIDLGSPLPALTNSVTIDGTTQSGYSGSPIVQIDGSALEGAGDNGLVLTGGGSTIQGLAIVGFSGSAIVLESGNGNVVDGDYLGVTPGGTKAIPNGQGLTVLGSSFNTIGSGSGGAGNVISGNSGNGVLIELQGMPSSGNAIDGNRIGTTADGLSALANTLSGIAIQGSTNDVIGSPGSGLGNVISGNLGDGISVTGPSSGMLIQNDAIGVAEDDHTALGNGRDGIHLEDAPGAIIGGPELSEAVVIGANHGDGINTSGATTGMLVSGDFIGTDPTGLIDLGNQGNGISLGSSSNTVGGSNVGAGNVIEFNGTGSVGAGVELVGEVDHDLIVSNSIYANAGLGINLGSGPTPNHAPGTAGPNDYQNYPTLTIAQSDGSQTIVQGSLYESPNSTYLIQLFSSPTEDSSGHGQGKSLVGATSVTTDADGNGSFTAKVPGGTQAGDYISATATDAANDTSEFSADAAVQGQIHLVLTASATPDPVAAGGSVTYTLGVANQGYIPATDVVLTDHLPDGVAISSVMPSQGLLLPPQSGGTITVDLGTIASGSSATVTIVVQTNAGSVGTMVDTASVTSAQADPETSDESATVDTTVLAVSDLSVALAEGPGPALDGSDLTYTIVVDNLGPNAAGNVEAILPVSTDATFISATTGSGSVSDVGGEVVADLGNLGVDHPVTVTVVLQGILVGELAETATVSGNVLDTDASNNTASVTTEIDPATDLAVRIASSAPVAGVGQDFQYVVTATNDGPMDASTVVLGDVLPTGVAFVSATADQGLVPTLDAGVVAVSFPTLGVGDSVNLTIVVEPTASPGATLSDSASVAGQLPDAEPSNNTAILDLPVQSVSDLAVSATAGAGPYLVGQPFTYTIDVTNQGPFEEPDAVLSGSLPPGMLVRSSTATQGAPPAISQGLLTANLGPLAADATATVTLFVAPGVTATGQITAGFAVQGEDIDPDPANDTAEVTVNVIPSTDLSVAIVPGTGPAVAQVDWTYTLTVENPGPSDATGVTATAPLPPDAQFVSVSSSQGDPPTEQAGTITADLGALAAGDSATITIVVEPTPAAAVEGSMDLSATVAGVQADPDAGRAQASLTVPVAPSVDLSVDLAANPGAIQSGQWITFTATVRNLGTTPATEVALTLPSVNGLVYGTPSPGQGTAAVAASQVVAQLGTLDPGASVTFTEAALATTAGTYIQSASLSDAQYNLDVPGAGASATAVVQEGAGIVQFGIANLSVNNTAGVAEIPVDRLYGTAGSITIDYRTIAVDATPGLDYVTTVGTLTLGPGQSSATIAVPVLNDIYENHNDLVDVVLNDPTGGAVLGGATTAALQIVDTDPDVTPPQVTGLTWSGTSRLISAVTLAFSAPLDPAYAANPANYRLSDLSRGTPVGIASISYNPSTFAVTIVPASPLVSGQFDQIQVDGTGATAIRDRAGNLLSGNGSGAPGSNYVASFAQGTKLKYTDSSGNLVTLNVKGSGYLEQVRDASGDGILLDIVGMVPRHTTLTGKIKAGRKGSGQTDLGTIEGLGQFGAVRVLLKSPPFRVKQLPFTRRGVGVL